MLDKLSAGKRTPLILGTIALIAVGDGIYIQQQQSAQQQVKESQFTLNKIAEIRPIDVMSAETDVI